MKRLLTGVLLLIQLIGCGNKKGAEKQNAIPKMDATSEHFTEQSISRESIFFDKGVSTFEIVSGSGKEGFEYNIVETNYKRAFISPLGDNDLNHYFAKYTTTTKSCTGCEESERNIRIDLFSFENPKKPVLIIDRNCDQLDLDLHTYKTTIIGCCASEDKLEVFDYKHNSIIKSDDKLFFGKIPNSKLEFYIGYKIIMDSLLWGEITLSYGSSEKYIVQIKSRRDMHEFCPPFSPDIEIDTGNEKEILSQGFNEKDLWSLSKIKDKSQINGLTVRLILHCDKVLGESVIEIPIVNGVPFGKETKVQEVYLGEE